ncbi:GNAT family N-acetyltransferase [Nocardia sp. NPDC050712]|uniref:GNAT family N-acetyltransferase n=1 Tax=Nocardia sp. NPDC050712 TaxID=3155518 RepID=UPI003404FC83
MHSTITRVDEREWHALDGDRVAGHGDVAQRPDGRLFLGIDAWHDEVFEQLAAAMLAELPGPVYTMVDEADRDLIARWERVGFTTRRREWEYLVPTGPVDGGPPGGVRILDRGAAQPDPLRDLDRALRDEVELGIGWPVAALGRPLDPAHHLVAVHGTEYVALARVQEVRVPRIGLIAVRPELRRRGIGRALLARALDTLRDGGFATAYAEVSEADLAATALFEGFGARRIAGSLELVRR